MKRIHIFSIFAALLFGVASCIVLTPGPERTLPAATRWAVIDTPTAPVLPTPTFVLTLTLERTPTLGPMPPPTVTPSPTAMPTLKGTSLLTAKPSWTPAPLIEPTSTPTEATPEPRVTIQEESVTIPTYQYQGALYTEGNFPYPRLDRSRMGPPIPVAYHLIVLENRCLRVSVLPQLGGRIYQCIYKPTEQSIFYNNAVIKPTHWGPEEMGWWLAAGGMEWAFPVEEHGYLSAEPWVDTPRRRDDGGATVTVEYEEKTRNLRVSVLISLLPEECYFEVAPRIENLGGEAPFYQFWLNAMLALGGDVPPETHFVMPAQMAYVHSSGDSSLPDPGGSVPWSQDSGLAYYSDWPSSWLGLFFAPLMGNIAEVYNEAAGIGIRRVFDPEATPGLKLFAFGTGFDPGNYTDDSNRYVELWGGITQDFWTYAELKPGQVVTWSERWYIVTQENQ